MFNGFANVWTPVEPAENLRSKPLKVRLAGEDLVIFRGKDGKVGALIDRCPHRSVAFSVGHTCKDGTIECPFHGWRFDTEGNCTHIPFNPLPSEKLRNYSALALPTREAGGLIWVYTGFGEAPELEVPPLLVDHPEQIGASVFAWKTHWTRGLENMLDFPHLPFAHRQTIGRPMSRQLRPDLKMEMTMEKTVTGFAVESFLDGRKQEAHIEFRQPNLSILSLFLPRGTVIMHIFAVPVDAENTRMFMVRRNSNRFLRPFWKLLARVNNKILFEDQLVVESTTPQEVPEPGVEKSVATDAPTLLFRKYYHHALRRSSVPNPWGTADGVVESSMAV